MTLSQRNSLWATQKSGGVIQRDYYATDEQVLV